MMYALAMRLGIDFFAALALAVVLGVALGAAIEMALLRPLRSSDIDVTMLVMIGAWIVLQNSEQLAWTGVAQSIKSPFPADPLVLGSLSVSWNRVFVFCIAGLLIAGTYLLVNRTKLGKAMRATFQDRFASLPPPAIKRPQGAASVSAPSKRSALEAHKLVARWRRRPLRRRR